MSHLADAVRALMIGGPVGDHAWFTLAWAAGIVLVTFPLAVRMYARRACSSGWRSTRAVPSPRRGCSTTCRTATRPARARSLRPPISAGRPAASRTISGPRMPMRTCPLSGPTVPDVWTARAGYGVAGGTRLRP
ncbi:hypothetical protein [Actinomadura sp. LOL_011]|uniref:hypothetical protein n=1 Tax=Actinomadura sp. LOL_011 TaxID=3345410 RepID=UPI003A807308